ncbi:TIGR04211 family SH3 domain-containing protein [Rheinheimera sp. 4Y26]|uniref:TIGR04211 family SH3 domain-containing protein n=1 Tax=Rheinheimera sp. 4Y26 TaxID=2977811 RepID=UPI0021B10ABA|nr:TIGR04211 family SH3 domain-containing protein [Rheinheimera sp. 4Y26]MCT6698868.1 TIGR04211 family SH3 domain-containing protein [Rheinheimera sp. 4Y26]
MSDLCRFMLLGAALTLSPVVLSQQTTQSPEVAAPTATENNSETKAEVNQQPVTTEAQPAAKASNEKPAFIIDTLSTAVRSGPGNEYRTISTVRAGENVTYIGQNPANGFIKIRDDAGTEGWLSGEYITYSASPKSDLESLKQQLRQQEMMVAQFEQERSGMQTALSAAEAARDQAIKEAELAKQTTAALTRQLAEQNPELAQNKMVIGGGILAAGLLLGLILPVFMPNRRRKDRWM